MSLTFSWGTVPGSLGTDRVRLGKVSLTMVAERGQFAVSDLPMDDPDADIVPEALRAVIINETACSDVRVFSGYAADRDLGRSDDSLITGVQRRWTGHVVDLNAVFTFDVLHGSGANRPAESCNARLAWLLSTNFGTIVADNGYVYTAPAMLSAADYRGQFPADVMQDLGDRSGYNWFAYADPAFAEKSLAFFPDLTYTGLDSTLRFTNDIADVEDFDDPSAVTFDASATLNRDPSQVYNGILLEWAGGQLYKTSGVVGVRQTTVSKPNITTLAHADAYADNWLDDHADEQDIITCDVDLPPSKVNLIKAGMRVQVKFTELDGYESYTWIRCTSCTKAQDRPTQERYRLTLTLKNPKATHGTGGGGGGVPPIPFPGGTPGSGLVNAYCARGGGWTLPFTPTSGDLLVVVASFRLAGALVTAVTKGGVDNGWTILRGGHIVAGDYPSIAVAAKISAGNENSDVLGFTGPGGGGSDDACWYEFSTSSIGSVGSIYALDVTTGFVQDYSLGPVVPSPSTFNIYAWATSSNTVGSPPTRGWHDTDAGVTADYQYDNNLGLWPATLIGHGAVTSPQTTYTRNDAFPMNFETIGFAIGGGDFTPAFGQDVPWACQNGDGTTVTFITEFPYIAGSLEVRVDGVPILTGLTETDPTTGDFTLDQAPHGVIGDSLAWKVCYHYKAGTT